MENTESIGALLKQERERRELTLEDVHDATKITPANLSALEEDNFDFFPNRVYTRAFLRDYCNFMGMETDALLSRYEEEWTAAQQPEIPTHNGGGSVWKAIGYTFLVLIICGGIGAAAYFYLQNSKKPMGAPDVVAGVHSAPNANNGATLPSADDTKLPAKPVPPVKVDSGTKPVPPVSPPATPEISTFQIAATMPVWVDVVVDGKRVKYGELKKDEVQNWPATKNVSVVAGMAGAIQVKINGVPQTLPTSTKVKLEKTFEMPSLPNAVPANPTTPEGGSTSTPAPTQPAKPSVSTLK